MEYSWHICFLLLYKFRTFSQQADFIITTKDTKNTKNILRRTSFDYNSLFFYKKNLRALRVLRGFIKLRKYGSM
ncbi:MAG: hypothetical protein B6245_17855 [Desulfobacteraceae bacterium 4572_88]|nr:MAG: hypothetical protein B6245_17855 [Desulfobacteraceae bacterium 4572_88]